MILPPAGVWMGAPSISMVPIALPSSLMARAKIAAVSPSAVSLLRTIEILAGVMPFSVCAKMPMFRPRTQDDFVVLVSTVVVGAVAAGLGIAGYGLDNGVADVDMATRFVGVEITGGDCNREPAFCERIHSRAVLDDDVVSSVKSALASPPSELARTVTVAPSSVMPL